MEYEIIDDEIQQEIWASIEEGQREQKAGMMNFRIPFRYHDPRRQLPAPSPGTTSLHTTFQNSVIAKPKLFQAETKKAKPTMTRDS